MPGRRGELKYLDVTFASAHSSTGVLTLLNGLAPGTGPSQRIGRKVKNMSLLYRSGIGSGDLGAAPFRGLLRTLIVYDKQANATAPTVNDILEGIGASSAMDMNNRDRFLVLFNRTAAIDQSGGNQSSKIELYKKMNLNTIFNAGTAGTIADITTGSIYLLTMAENANNLVTPTNFPITTFYSRIRYDDS